MVRRSSLMVNPPEEFRDAACPMSTGKKKPRQRRGQNITWKRGVLFHDYRDDDDENAISLGFKYYLSEGFNVMTILLLLITNRPIC